MYAYIVCFCGRSLGDLFDLFREMRAIKYADAYSNLDFDIDPNLLAITESVQVKLDDVLDDLCLNLDCCRTHMLTQVEFAEIY